MNKKKSNHLRLVGDCEHEQHVEKYNEKFPDQKRYGTFEMFHKYAELFCLNCGIENEDDYIKTRIIIREFLYYSEKLSQDSEVNDNIDYILELSRQELTLGK